MEDYGKTVIERHIADDKFGIFMSHAEKMLNTLLGNIHNVSRYVQ